MSVTVVLRLISSGAWGPRSPTHEHRYFAPLPSPRYLAVSWATVAVRPPPASPPLQPLPHVVVVVPPKQPRSELSVISEVMSQSSTVVDLYRFLYSVSHHVPATDWSGPPQPGPGNDDPPNPARGTTTTVNENSKYTFRLSLTSLLGAVLGAAIVRDPVTQAATRTIRNLIASSLYSRIRS